VRGLPDRSEREAAEGGALPITGADGAQPTPSTQDPAGGVA